MGIFSKVKAAKENKNAKDGKADGPKAPVKREPYVPRYAVRDALQCAPTTWKQDSYDAFRKAHQERSAREQADVSFNGWSNPKLSSSRLSMSRNSSALSVAMMDGSRPSSSRRHSMHANPFASGSSSYTSVSGLANNDPPVPAIPAQYTYPAGSSTPRSLSRNSSYQKQPQSLEAHLQSNAASSSRPGAPVRHSYAGYGSTGIMKKTAAHDFGSTPMESPEETPNDTPAGSRSVTPNDAAIVNANLSSAASTSSESSGERIEMPSRHDSPHDSPQMTTMPQMQNERTYPADPRKLGKAPVITVEETSAPEKRYFSHANKPVEKAPASPPPPPQKKARFSLIRRSQQVVAAH
ncbi:hypothetical protein CAC42_7136 [Sphaceloma murrayae]|uniref:Uncharacterized protein n=1 Tax=Sphaceloma murrayae TaxID=2082308 RepID=A0A2K1QRG1_9PEZI|nr:hypothetical protein CAC42_7136 [Sphaceloma murrayae]